MSAPLVFMVLVWWGLLLTNGCLGDKAVFVREGDNVTLDCLAADATDIWMISWEISYKNHHWKSIMDCLLNKWLKPCPFIQGELMYRNTTLQYHSDLSFSDDISFISRLTILNIIAVMRHAFIRCILGEMHNFTFITQEAYHLNVYALPTEAVCTASINNDSDVSIACQISKVYPRVTCVISVEFVEGTNSSASHSQLSQGLELVDTDYSKYKVAGYTHYDVSCNAKYAPVEEGTYRFHKIYTTKNVSLMSVKSNWITVNAQVSEYQKVKMRNKDTTEGQKNMGLRNDHNCAGETGKDDTSKAFYLLLGAIIVLGLTGIVALVWVVWLRCRKRCALSDTDYAPKSNIYETIQSETTLSSRESARQPGSCNESVDERASDANGALSSGAHNDDYSSVHDLLPGIYDNRTIALLRQCIETLRSGQDTDAYITPCTPELTPEGSVNTTVHTPELTSRGSVNTSVHTPELSSRGSVNTSVYTPELKPRGSVNTTVHTPELKPRGSVNTTVHTPELSPRGSVNTSVHTPELSSRGSVNTSFHAPCTPELT